MASASVSHLILFIASLLVAASVAGTMTAEVDRLDDAIADQGLDVSQQVRSDVEVISDPGSPVYNVSGDENVTLLVKNTGSRDLPTDGTDVDVVLDGRYQTDVWIEPVAGAWDEGDVVRLHVPESLAAGDHRLKLVVGGDEEVFRFRT